LKQKEFIQELRRLGGIPAEVLADAKIVELFLLILQADFEILNKSNLASRIPWTSRFMPLWA